MFAKLYDTNLGQILVKQDTGDDGVEVRVYFEPDGLGICSLAFSYGEDSEELQWDKTDKVFEELTEVKCISLVEEVLYSLKGE